MADERNRRVRKVLIVIGAVAFFAGIPSMFICSPLMFLSGMGICGGGSHKGDTPSQAREPLIDDSAEIAAALEKKKINDYTPLSLSKLAGFEFKLSDDGKSGNNQIPNSIKVFDGKKIAVRGYMIPTELKAGKTSNFLLIRPDVSGSCKSLAPMPRMNEWLRVHLTSGKTLPAVYDTFITVVGTLHVGEEKDLSGEILSIYRLEADDAITD